MSSPAETRKRIVHNILELVRAAKTAGVGDIFHRHDVPDDPRIAMSVSIENPTVTDMCRAFSEAGYSLHITVSKDENA